LFGVLILFALESVECLNPAQSLTLESKECAPAVHRIVTNLRYMISALLFSPPKSPDVWDGDRSKLSWWLNG